MKPCFLATALALSASVAFAQPADYQITQWFEHKKNNGQHPDFANMKRNPEIKIMYMTGAYTFKNTNECLVLYPVVINGRQKSDYLLLMQKTRNGWIDSHLLSKFVDDVKLRDVNKDGVLEVFTEVATVGQGNIEGKYELFSFKDGVMDTLFTTNFFDLTAGSAYNSAPGAVIAKESSIRFEDLDKDGDEEIIELISLKKLLSITNGKVEVITEENTQKYQLVDGRYVSF